MDSELLEFKIASTRTSRNEMASMIALAVGLVAFAFSILSDAINDNEGMVMVAISVFTVLVAFAFFILLITSIVKTNKKLSSMISSRDDVLNNTVKASTTW